LWGGDLHQAISENGSAAWSAKKKNIFTFKEST